MTMMTAAAPEPQLSEDAKTLARFADPFAQVFFLNKLKSYILGLALVVIGVEALMIARLASQSSAHVYELRPNGEAVYVGDREASLQPREAEAKHLARAFITQLYAYNSSTVADDLAAAINLCDEAMANKLRQDAAESRFIDEIRKSHVRSEIELKQVTVLEHAPRLSRVSVEGWVRRYDLAQYEGAPLEQRAVKAEVIMAAVPRDPVRRPNGLEVVRLVQMEKVTASGRKEQ
jgi:hypothetical protein